MGLLYILELTALAIGIAFVMTQAVLPLVLKEPWFPIFRKRRVLEHRLAVIHEKLSDSELEDHIDTMKKALEKRKAPREEKRGRTK